MKNIIEKTVLGAALVLAVFVGPALSSAGSANQQAAGIKGVENARGAIDYKILDPLNRDQLIGVIKCLADGKGTGVPKCVTRVVQSAANLIVSNTANPMRSSNFRIPSSGTLSGVPMVTFNAKSEIGTSVINSVQVSINGAKPITMHLYDGAILLKSKAMTDSEAVDFDNLNLSIPKDTVKMLTVKADFGSNTLSDTISVANVYAVAYSRGNGTSDTVTSGVEGPSQHLFSALANIKLVSAPSIIAPPPVASGTPMALIATFPLQFEAKGGTISKPISTDFSVYFEGPGMPIQATNKSVVVIPNSDIADGVTSNVTVTAYANSANVPQSGLYSSKIKTIRWKAGSVTASQDWGLEDLKTPPVQFTK